MSRSTYRLQLRPGFGFAEVAGVADYLAALGITHVYLSPITEAAAGTTHGYDVVDPTRIDRELGGPEGFARMNDVLRDHGLRVLLDIVPNHNDVFTPENRWWWDVLKHGRASPYAGHYDIDWDAPDPDLQGRILVPILGDEGGLIVDQWLDEPALRYYDHWLPLNPVTVTDPLPPVDELLPNQHYLVTHWREAATRLNYRRFFDITNLCGVNVENEDVFADTHIMLAPLAAERVVDGLRVDHIDGLRDPEEYLTRLAKATSDAWVVIEKITNAAEELPDTWQVAGTTGYEFLNTVTGLFVDPRGEAPMTGLYQELCGEQRNFPAIAYEARHHVLANLLVPEWKRLSRWAPPEGIAEVLANLTIYRTYGQFGRPFLEEAIEAARARRPDLAAEINAVKTELAAPKSEFTQRFEQLSCGVAAMGVEDTAFYRYQRLMALNEVGGDPARFGISLDEFHRSMARLLHASPGGLLATATHDTKWGEDTRVRLAMLSEMPDAWADAVRRWHAHNTRHRIGGWPDAGAEYLMYQALVGAFPLTVDRLVEFLGKATKEAKVHTSWVDPDPTYDTAVEAFARAVMVDPQFMAELDGFARPLVWPSSVSAMSQLLLKVTAPGVPDTYQGDELWDLSLVDPDNRRTVDFELRRALVPVVEHMALDEVRTRADEGLPKLMTLYRALRARRVHSDAFDEGAGYDPLRAAGPKADHLVAFRRSGPRSEAITLAPRLVLGLDDDWGDTTVALPDRAWRNALTHVPVAGGTVALRDVLGEWPVALLVTT